MPIYQVDAQLQVVRKLEEKERLLQGTIGTAERELALRTQALDMNKRKVRHCLVAMSHSKVEWSKLIPVMTFWVCSVIPKHTFKHSTYIKDCTV